MKKIAEEYLKRAPVLLSAIEGNKVPDPIGATKEQCKYCAYKGYCKKDGSQKISPPFLLKKGDEHTKDKKSAFLM